MTRKKKVAPAARVEYSSNNSGGRWWLNDKQWAALEKAGWVVAWLQAGFSAKPPYPTSYAEAVKVAKATDRRFLDALATSATRRGLSLRDAVDEWEKATGESSTDAGCPCCGTPHSFTAYDKDGNYLESGPEASYEASW